MSGRLQACPMARETRGGPGRTFHEQARQIRQQNSGLRQVQVQMEANGTAVGQDDF